MFVKENLDRKKKKNENNLNENLEKLFSNTCKFCTLGINRFILMLRKFIFPYENMDY